MTWAALGAAAAGGVAPERFGQVDGIAAAVATILTAVAGIALTVVKSREASRAQVSSDERNARAQAATDRKDTLSQWQELVEHKDLVIAQKDRDLARKDADIAAVAVERDRFKRIAEEYERLHDEDRVVRMIHGAWDFTTYEVAHRADPSTSPPPPLIAPRSAKEE